ncbi:hypothetical protein Taro_039738 [Colocasia esculenta]|uniref:Uncharacterized protein n=1 Tax=Colocasia esculenta TaxID=4460 RepID=A0A843WJS2_COLES|nr:hypothetical protein [Colocasia esculenta]
MPCMGLQLCGLQIVRLCGPAGWAQKAHKFSVCECSRGWRRVLNVTVLSVTFWLPPFAVFIRMSTACCAMGDLADVNSGKAMASYVAFLSRQ